MTQNWQDYLSSKQFLLNFVNLNITNKEYKVNRGVYASIPTTTGSIRYKANDIFLVQYKDEHIISFVRNGKTYEPTWPQVKLNEWLNTKLRLNKAVSPI